MAGRAPRSFGKRLRSSVRNAVEIARFGGLGDVRHTSFEVVDRGPHHRLRRYFAGDAEVGGDAPVALLVPPLMLTADVYDIAPDVSATAALLARGIAPWVVDFGAPERELGGMSRSLDDHIRAVVQSAARARELAGRDIHLCGYSQGGMFAYQAAAFVRGRGIRSLLTFGSPIDIHKNVPAVRSDVAGAAFRSMLPIAKRALSHLEGLPGRVTSTAFKLASSRKELEQQIEFLRTLHDRDRSATRQARRHFLGGAGFVAWPGPAFRAFVEEFVVHNRMLSGGFVIEGRAVSLADLACPILAFVGEEDEIARPATVRAISHAAPNAVVRFITVATGHFGLVVGSRANATTWPAAARWMTALDRGASPDEALPPGTEQNDDAGAGANANATYDDAELDLLAGVASRAARKAWHRLGDVAARVSDTAHVVRWQEPQLRRLARVEPDTRVSASGELARRARETPDATFFLWQGRAFRYAEADARVTSIARRLWSAGVRRGARVGVVMTSGPDMLAAVTALGRLGATAVVAPLIVAAGPRAVAFAGLEVRLIVVDPEHAELAPASTARLVVDGEVNAASGPPWPGDVEIDPGRARDLAYVFLRDVADDAGGLRVKTVTNHRWAREAIGAAAACALEPGDTVCCALPLHHPTGLLVSVGAALAGRARLVLVPPPTSADDLVTEIRRAGVTVCFYAGEMLRPLVELRRATPADQHLPLRLFAGSGIPPALAALLGDRFGVDTMELLVGDGPDDLDDAVRAGFDREAAGCQWFEDSLGGFVTWRRL